MEKIEETKEDNNLVRVFNPLGLLKQLEGGMIDQFMQISQVSGSRGSSKINRVFVQYKANYNELGKMLTVLNQYHATEEKLLELKYNNRDPAEQIKKQVQDVLTFVAGADNLDSLVLKARELDTKYEYLRYSLDTLYRSFRSSFYSSDTEEMDETEKELWKNIMDDLDNYYQRKLKDLSQQQTPDNPFSNELKKVSVL